MSVKEGGVVWWQVRGEWEGNVWTGGRLGERGQNKLLDRGAMGFSTGEGWREKGVRVRMRG
jgi:hypothetical protein